MRNKRRGNVVVGALALIPMLGFAALSVDIGLQRTVNVQMQTALDSAVVSGAGYLDGTDAGVYRAINEATTVAGQNTVYFDYAPTADNVIAGLYENGEFTELDPIDYDQVNAIRMIDDHTYNSILARAAFGATNMTSDARATAVRRTGGGAKYVDCYLPFAVPICHFLDLDDGSNPAPMELDLANLNTVGWGMPLTNPNTTTIKEQFADVCANGTAQVYDADDGDTESNNVNLSNGQNNSAVDYAMQIINGVHEPTITPSEWPYEYFASIPARNGIEANLPTDSLISSDQWSMNIKGVIPIVDVGCGDGFVGDSRILGWTYAYIFDGKTTGSGGKNVWIQFDVVNDYDIGYGYDPDAVGNVLGSLPAQLVD